MSRLGTDKEIAAIRIQAVSDLARLVLRTRKAEPLSLRLAGASLYEASALYDSSEIAHVPFALYDHSVFQ